MTEHADRAVAAAEQIMQKGHTELIGVLGPGLKALTYAVLDLATAVRERA